jgi:AcrR family transcriptional regulator
MSSLAISVTLDRMGRWEPNARERLQEAAMDLFEKHGYDRTTVGDIAARAGLTERTFFRYFIDKREVLFARSEELEKGIVDVIASAPQDATPLGAVGAAIEAAGADLQGRFDLHLVRARHALVMKHAEIRERELIKLASLATAVTKALHARGVSEPAASLAAEAGIAVFKVGFERWISQRKPQELAAQLRASMAALRAVAAEGKARGRRPNKKPMRRG